MKSKIGLSQEWLKAIACITMLIDHIGAMLFPQTVIFRMIGRISFPIYCFLLVEGFYRTRDKKKYITRMAICAIVTEPIYDFAFTGALTLHSQSVMITLMLGFAALYTLERCKCKIDAVIAIVAYAILNEILGASYGIYGIGMILMFAYTRERDDKLVANVFLTIILNVFQTDIQIFALLALPIINLYNGKKLTNNKAAQIGFYAFYPMHLLILYIIQQVAF